MAPGDVAHVPRTPSPVAGASLVAKHFRSRARLRRLLVRLRRPTPSTPALRATPGGASLTTFGFVTTVPRYLLEASNPLTFVRGACRAYCAPRKCHCDLIFVRRVSAIAALFMRRARVMLTDRCFACTGCTHAPRRALAGALGSGTLPHALIVRHESGYGDRPSPACASRRATPKGVERAPGSGTLPPHAPPGGALAGALGSGTLPPHASWRGIGGRTRQRHLAAGSGTLPPHVCSNL